MRAFLSSVYSALISFVFPPRCALCDSSILHDDAYICTPCAASLNPVDADFTAPHLAHVWFDRACSVYPFEGKLRDALHGFKYGERFDLTAYLTRVLESAIHRMDHPDMIVPVPLHPKRLRKRGFNQAVQAARPLAKRMGVTCDMTTLVRATDPGPQVERERAERIKAVKGIFVVKDSQKIKGKNILLIDDVLTTGATVNECARVLKKADARRVDVLTIARTL